MCPHGFAPADCLICRTLARGSAAKPTAPAPNPTAPAPTPTHRASAPSGGPGDLRLGRPADPGLARADAVYPPGSRPGPRGRPPRTPSGHLMAVLLGVVLIALIAWVVAGALFALFHLIELVLVAAAAGWAGYRWGHFRGSRARR